MTEHVYSISWSWALIEMMSGVAYWMVSLLFLIAFAVLAFRQRSAWTATALLGAILMAGERVTRFMSNGLHWVYLGGRQPLEGQNPLEMLFFLHGGNLGYLLIAIGLIGFILRNRAAWSSLRWEADPTRAPSE